MPKKYVYNRTQVSRRKYILWMLLMAVSVAGIIFSGFQIYKALNSYAVVNKEYENLRQNYQPPASIQGDAAKAAPDELPPIKDINPDYVGWLSIEGTNISYPVVQGKDNEKYLNTTFEGQQNPLGAIFLDAACKQGVNSPFQIIYGHNAKDGNMFGGLASFTKHDYLSKHGTATFTLPNGEQQNYIIFRAEIQNAYDPVYGNAGADEDQAISFAQSIEAPEGTRRILVLSTCTNGSDKDERIAVYAALQE